MKKINDALEEVEENGAMIRRIFGEYNMMNLMSLGKLTLP